MAVKAAILFFLLSIQALADLAAGQRALENGDYATALKEFLPLAKQGNASAQFILGTMYANGEGVPQDYTEAAKLYRLAAEQGHPRAQFNLGFMYHDGRGVAQNYKEAAKWYRLAAEQGEAEAQFILGTMYGTGQGVPQDYKEAVRWYRLAADQGHPHAQFSLGTMYGKGQGVPQDYVQAHNLAGSTGDADGVKERDGIANKMTPSQIAEAQRLAREWKPTTRMPRSWYPAAVRRDSLLLRRTCIEQYRNASPCVRSSVDLRF